MNQSLVESLFSRCRIPSAVAFLSTTAKTGREIVGVAGDVRERELSQQPKDYHFRALRAISANGAGLGRAARKAIR